MTNENYMWGMQLPRVIENTPFSRATQEAMRPVTSIRLIDHLSKEDPMSAWALRALANGRFVAFEACKSASELDLLGGVTFSLRQLKDASMKLQTQLDKKGDLLSIKSSEESNGKVLKKCTKVARYYAEKMVKDIMSDGAVHEPSEKEAEKDEVIKALNQKVTDYESKIACQNDEITALKLQLSQKQPETSSTAASSAGGPSSSTTLPIREQLLDAIDKKFESLAKTLTASNQNTESFCIKDISKPTNVEPLLKDIAGVTNTQVAVHQKHISVRSCGLADYQLSTIHTCERSTTCCLSCCALVFVG